MIKRGPKHPIHGYMFHYAVPTVGGGEMRFSFNVLDDFGDVADERILAMAQDAALRQAMAISVTIYPERGRFL